MPSFTAKVVVKVASFKKGANKVIAKLSLKKSVNKKDTLVERLNASKKAAAAVEVAEEAGDVAAVALTQQGQVKAALVDAILQTDQDTVYLRPSCSLGGSFDDDEDEDEDDAPATVWESASSGFTTHHNLGSAYLPSLASVFLNDDETHEPPSIPRRSSPKWRLIKYALYDSGLPILEEVEEEEEVTAPPAPIPTPSSPSAPPSPIDIAAPKPVAVSQINTIPFPLFQNASFDSLLLAEQMGIAIDDDCPYLYYANAGASDSDSDGSLESRLRTLSPPFAGAAVGGGGK